MKDSVESRWGDVNSMPSDDGPEAAQSRLFAPWQLEELIALRLAEEFTESDPEGKEPQDRLDHGMFRREKGPDGFPTVSPVTPREVAEVMITILQDAAKD